MRRYCSHPRCRVIVERGTCEQHRKKETDRYNADVRKLYRTPRWHAMRAKKRREDPLCVDCRKEGRTVPWFALDHIKPHRGDLTLFWDEKNLEGRCEQHHNAKTGRGQ